MRKLKIFTIVLLVCATMALVSVCSAGIARPTAKANVKEIVTIAIKNLEKRKDMHINTGIKRTFVYNGQAITIRMLGEFDVQGNTIIGKSTVTYSVVSSWRNITQQTVFYLEQTGDQVYVYSNKDGSWVKLLVPNKFPLLSYNKYFKEIKHIKFLRETADSMVFEVTENGNMGDLYDFIKQFTAIWGVQNYKLPADVANSKFELICTVAIDKKTYNVIKVEYDNVKSKSFAAVIKNIFRTLPVSYVEKAKLSKMVDSWQENMTMNFYPVNAANKVAFPAEVEILQLGTRYGKAVK